MWSSAAVSSQILEFVHKTIADESAGSHGSSQVAGLICQIFSRSRDHPFFKQHHQTGYTLNRETRQRRVPDDADSFADNAASFKRKIVSWRSCLKESVSSLTVVLGSLGRLGYALICSNLMLSFSIWIPWWCSRVTLVGFYQLFWRLYL